MLFRSSAWRWEKRPALPPPFPQRRGPPHGASTSGRCSRSSWTAESRCSTDGAACSQIDAQPWATNKKPPRLRGLSLSASRDGPRRSHMGCLDPGYGTAAGVGLFLPDHVGCVLALIHGGVLCRIADIRGVFVPQLDRKSTRLNSSHKVQSRMPSSA